jgi:hypothetical protein
MSSSFVALNLKGMEGSFSGELRCWSCQYSVCAFVGVCTGHTTFRLSLLGAAKTRKCRCCGLVELRNVLAALRRAHGANLDDIAIVRRESSVSVSVNSLQ